MVIASIDAAALRHNLQVVRQRAPGARVMAVIKANAYGHGLATVAHALKAADAFAVARVDEGLALRAAGITQSIVLLEGVFDQQQLQAAVREQFELVVHTAEQIQLLKAAPIDAPIRIWLKLDTGMNRLGLKPEEFMRAYATLSDLACVANPVRLFTHMANADMREDPGTREQFELFESITRSLPGMRSLANSATLLSFPPAIADWVRPGLMLFGASPFAATTGADYGLKAVMTLRSQVIAVKQIRAGERVGYGGAWTAERDTVLAIGAVGYGDGYPRSVANGTPVLINGRRASIAGRVSMDMIAVDVTDLPRPQLGDEVILWGAGLPVEEIAARAGTIAYELLCAISQRVAVELR